MLRPDDSVLYLDPNLELEISKNGELEDLTYKHHAKSSPLHLTLVKIWINFHIAYLAWKAYKSIKKVRLISQYFKEFNQKLYTNQKRRKYVKKGGQYLVGMYIPPFPSQNFDRLVLTEMNNVIPHNLPKNTYQQVNFAITTKCPMRCEHCFEWDNLNLKESFSLEALKKIVGTLQKNGLGQISLSGGEPMVRFKEMLELISSSSKTSAWWVLSAGFGLNEEKAKALKEAGTTGVVISLDHYEPDLHNQFRGYKGAFDHAIKGIHAANSAGLFVALSVCLTKFTANRYFLYRYAALANELEVDFIQWLEPKAEGHYRGKDVLLSEGHISILEEVYEELNNSKEHQKAPQVLYHGYYQRRLGCLSGGKYSLYIDARGMVHSCPFCHSGDFHIMDMLNMPVIGKGKVTKCESY